MARAPCGQADRRRPRGQFRARHPLRRERSMSITLRCPCGQLIALADTAVPRIRCPKCNVLLGIPAQARTTAAPPPLPLATPAAPSAPRSTPPPLPGSDMYALASTQICPNCRKEWPADTVLCVECGYNFRTGAQRKRVIAVREDSLDFGTPAIGSYSRYTVRRNSDGAKTLIIQSWLLWVPAGAEKIPLDGFDA